MSTKHFGAKVTDVMLPRKARNIINKKYLYPKPTQVDKYRILRSAR